jgi:hypothetical protein
MCCTTLTMGAATMATKQFERADCCDICWSAHDKCEAAFRLLRMNWVVATDVNGIRRPQMRWRTNRAD